MNCPKCGSTHINKNGHCRGKQNYRCRNCGRQFVGSRSTRGYSEDAKQICLKMYRDGIGFRAIGRVTGISHNTIINWVKQIEPDRSSDPSDTDEPNRENEHYPYKNVQLTTFSIPTTSYLLKKIFD